MFSLRHKLWFGFGGLLIVLLVVGIMGIVVVTRSGGAIQRVMRENYDSIAACQRMGVALAQLDRQALETLLDGGERQQASGAAQGDIHEFEEALKFQQGNVTVPGEQEATDRLTSLWDKYRALHARFLSLNAPSEQRRKSYSTELLPVFRALQETTQQISDLNLGNITSVDGQVRRLSEETRSRMTGFLAFGVAAGVLFVIFVTGSILGPVRAITRAFGEIGHGNMEVVVEVKTQDEIGHLAEAFNSMTAGLRSFRRNNRARILRLEHTTQQAIDSIPSAVAVISPEGRIELANRVAQAIFGIRPELELEDVANARWLWDLFRQASEQGRLC